MFLTLHQCHGKWVCRGCPAISMVFSLCHSMLHFLLTEFWGKMLFRNYIHLKHCCMGLAGPFVCLFFPMKLCGEQNNIELPNRMFLTASLQTPQHNFQSTVQSHTLQQKSSGLQNALQTFPVWAAWTFCVTVLQRQGAGTSHAVPLLHLFRSGLFDPAASLSGNSEARAFLSPNRNNGKGFKQWL